MSRAARLFIVVAIAVATPVILTVNSIRLLANDWYIHFEYGRPGFPPDAYGLTGAERTALALIGLRSVLPAQAEGIDSLRQARLPDGSPAFNARELQHMSDVRALLGRVYPLHLVAIVALVALAIAFHRTPATRRVVPLGLRAGAILTLSLAAALVAYILINFNTFFTQFHQIFFEGTSWQFQFTDTLIRLYPIPFWSDAATFITLGTVAQALGLLAGAWVWLRRLDREAALVQPAALES